MPKLTSSAPKYRKHRASGQAVVSVGGKDYYLGPHGTRASKAEYDRRIAEWLANGRRMPTATEGPQEALTVAELMAQYVAWAKSYYVESAEVPNILYALRPLKELYGRAPASQFGPLSLKAVRQKMVAAGLCRAEVNKRIGRVKRMFKWGVENELIPPGVFHALQAVRGLARGRSEARESEAVKPVPEAFVDAIKGFVVPQVWAMIELQRCTAARPGEICSLRTADLDTTSPVWVFTPPKHKTAHHGHQRQIFLGPRAQEILRPWLRTNLQEHLFQPREAAEWLRNKRHAERKTPENCGNVRGSNVKRKPKRVLGERYTNAAYMTAIRRACRKAGVPHWHPHQLRHTAATKLRKEFGLDLARCVLGHKSHGITEVYAERDFDAARSVIGRIG